MGILPDYIDAFIFEKQVSLGCNLECKILDFPEKSTLTLTWRPTQKGLYNQQYLKAPQNKSPSKRKRNFHRANNWKAMQSISGKSREWINNSVDPRSYGYKLDNKATDVSTPAKSVFRELDQDLATPDSGCNSPPPTNIKDSIIDSDLCIKQIVETEFACEQYSDSPEICNTKSCCFTTVKGDYNYAISISTVPAECTTVTMTEPANLNCDTKRVTQNNVINKNSILFSDEDLCLNNLFNECDNFDFCFDTVTLAEGPRHKKLRASYGPIIVYMNLLNDKDKYAVSPEIHYQQPDYHYHWKYHRYETDISRRPYRFNKVKHHVIEMKDILINYLKEHNLKLPKQ